MLYLVDTSIRIFSLGHKAIPDIRQRVEALVSRHEAAICPPIAFELLRGIQDGNNFKKLLDYLSNLELLELDWIEAARWSAQPPVRHLQIKSADALIAHTALRNNAILVHADSDFDRIAKVDNLKVESWIKQISLQDK